MRWILKFLNTGDHLSSTLLTGWKRFFFIAVIFTTGSVCCGIYSTSVGAFNSWDLRNYQYYSPYALLTDRSDFDYAPAQIQTFLNPIPFVPFYVVTTHFKPIVAGFIMGVIHGIVAGFLFLTAMTIFSSLSPRESIFLSFLCATLGIYGPTFLAFLGGSGSDHIASLFVLGGVYVLVRGIKLHGAPDMRETRLALLIGAVLIGIAAGLKLVCTVFLIGCGISVLVTGRRFRSRLAATGLFGAASIVGALVSRGHWMVLLWSRFGNPLFPFYNKIFRSPYFYDKNLADNRWLPRTFTDAILLPLQFITETNYTHKSHDFRDIRYVLVYGLVLLCIAVFVSGLIMLRLRRPLSKYQLPNRAEMFLLVFFVISYVIWQMKFAILRYAVPLELLAPILIAVLIRLLLPWKEARQIVTIAAFTAIALIMQPMSIQHRSWSSAYIDVRAPWFDNPDETLVIIANSMPRAYVIPAFQPEVRFIGLANTFNNPRAKHQHRAAYEMYNMIQSHNGPIYILSSKQRIKEDVKSLMPYKIVLAKKAERYLKSDDVDRASDSVLQVITKQENTRLYLWPVETYSCIWKSQSLPIL